MMLKKNKRYWLHNPWSSLACFCTVRSQKLQGHWFRLIFAALVLLTVILVVAKRKRLFQKLHGDDYFHLQSHESLQQMLRDMCRNLSAEQDLKALPGRSPDGSSYRAMAAEVIADHIIDVTNTTRQFVQHLLRRNLHCPTIDLPSLRTKLKAIGKTDRCMECVIKPPLPATFISTNANVGYSEYWNGHRLPMLGVAPLGRLGNVMGEYATLVALRKIFNVSAVLTNDHKTTLINTFPFLSLPEVYVADSSEWIGLPVDVPPYPNYSALELASLGLLGPYRFLVQDYPFEMQLFNAFREDILREFRFTSSVMERAHKFLFDVSKRAVRKRQEKPLTFIGVHIRLTDYMHHMHIVFGVQNMTYDNYIYRAVQHYNARYDNPVFVVASDDPSYVQDFFFGIGQTNAFYSIDGSPGEDMGLLSQCNHSIISFGSFGFWTAYLSGGTTLYPDVNTSVPYSFTRTMYEEAHLDNFVPLPLYDDEVVIPNNSASAAFVKFGDILLAVIMVVIFRNCFGIE